jgi:hypothetical protein
MVLSPAQFAAQYSGQTGVGGGCGGFPDGECTALACLWCRNLGLGTPCNSCGNCGGNGYHCDGVCWQGSGYAGWTWIANGQSNFPSPGDLVVFQSGYHGVGCHGHVDLCLSATPTQIVSLANNWGCNLCCQVVTHTDYNGVVGWQHPSASPPAPAPAPPPPTCSPVCDSCSVCQGTRCVSSCPAGWACAGGLCSPPPAPAPSPSPSPPPATPSAEPAVAAGLVLAALTALAAWQAVRRRPGPGLGGGASRSPARRATAGTEMALTPSATSAGQGFGGDA